MVTEIENDDFNVELKNNLLNISSEKKFENDTTEGDNYSKREFSYQSFLQSYNLPTPINTGKITAKYENGILLIKISKKQIAKPKLSKPISIS